MDQEIASIIHFVLEASGNPTPYYTEIPADFCVPSAYFPEPEIEDGSDVLSGYALTISLFIDFHGATSAAAYSMAADALDAIKCNRSIIQMISPDGSPAAGYVRIDRLSAKVIDSGTAQLYLSFVSRRTIAERQQSVKQFYLEIAASNHEGG